MTLSGRRGKVPVAWDKVSPEDFRNYKTLLEFHLHYLSIPSTLMPCSEFSCIIHKELIMDLYMHILNILKNCAYGAIPTQLEWG